MIILKFNSSIVRTFSLERTDNDKRIRGPAVDKEVHAGADP